MEYLPNMIKLYLNIIGLILFFSLLKRLKTFNAPLFAFSTVFFVIFPFTLFGAGRTAYRIVQIINGLCLAVSLFIIFCGYDRYFRSVRESVPMLILFTLIFFCAGLLLRFYMVAGWDESNNYCATAQSLLVQGRKALLNIAHPEYPYAIGIIQAYSCFVSGFNEPFLCFVQQLIVFAACFQIAGYTKHPVRSFVFLIFSAIFLHILFPTMGFTTICQDGLIGTLFASMLVEAAGCSELPDRAEILIKSIQFSFFLFVKDMAAALIIIVFAVLLVNQYSSGSQRKAAALGKIFITGIITILPYVSWYIYKKINGIGRSHDFGNFTIANVLSTFNGSGNEYANGLNRFLDVIFKESFGATGISLYQVFVLLVLIMIIDFAFSRNRKELMIGLMIAFGGIAYFSFCGCAYIYMMGKYYRTTFSEFSRFISCHMIGWALFTLWNVSKDLSLNENKRQIFISRSALLLLMVSAILIKTPVDNLFRQNTGLLSEYLSYRKQFKPLTEKYRPCWDTSKKIAIMAEETGFFPRVSPILINDWTDSEIIDWSISTTAEPWEASTEDLRELLDENEITYLVLYDRSTGFLSRHEDLFSYDSSENDPYPFFERKPDGTFHNMKCCQTESCEMKSAEKY